LRLRGVSESTLAHGLLLFTAFVWGATFVLVKAALSDASPLLFNLLRMSVATVALAAINHRALRGVTRRQLAAGGLAGLFLAAGYQFQTFGLTLTTPAKSAFITGMVVVFVPALTVIPALRPKSTPRPDAMTGVGAFCAFAGLLLITTPAGTTLRTLFSSIGTGDLITLACALAFAAHLLTLARVSPGIPTGLLATLQIAACTGFMLISLSLERPHIAFTPRVLVALAICGLIATAAAFTIQSYAQRHLPPTHTVVLLALEPVFAWLTSLLFLHESLGQRSLAGAALILAGIAIIEFLPTTHTTEIPA
jgi:drug/metabolite transporter (DMT)-like permease